MGWGPRGVERELELADKVLFSLDTCILNEPTPLTLGRRKKKFNIFALTAKVVF